MKTVVISPGIATYGAMLIGGIVRLWQFRKIEYCFHHFLYLAFFSRAVSGDLLLDFVWCVLMHRNLGLG